MEEMNFFMYLKLKTTNSFNVVVSISQLLFLRLSHISYFFQHIRMDISKNKEMEFDHTFVNRFFMVCFRNMVWLGILFLYRLALACKKTSRLPRQIKFIHSFSCLKTYRH